MGPIRDAANHAAYVAEFARPDPEERDEEGRSATNEYGYRRARLPYDAFTTETAYTAHKRIKRARTEGYTSAEDWSLTLGVHLVCLAPYASSKRDEKYVILEIGAYQPGGIGATPLRDPRESPLHMDYSGANGKYTREASIMIVRQGRLAAEEMENQFPEKRQWDLKLSAGRKLPRWWCFDVRLMRGGQSLALVLMREIDDMKSSGVDTWRDGRKGRCKEKVTTQKERWAPDEYVELRMWWGYGNWNRTMILPLGGMIETLEDLG